jgi:hypothetical protein
LSVYDWVRKEYPSRPAVPAASEPVRHPFHHQTAVKALQLFSRLPATERAVTKERLQASLVSTRQWLTHLEQTRYQIVCLGELHEEATRNFLSEEIFARGRMDVLLLEATPAELKRLRRLVAAGRDYYPLLGADILNALRAVKAGNPDIRVVGIEATEQQAEKQSGNSNARDQAIAQNFWDAFQPGLRHIILFGALHCANESNWLYHGLFNRAPPALQKEMLNVKVLGQHQDGPVEALVYFMDEIGIEKRDVVIPDTRSLPAPIYAWFPLLTRQTLEKYQALIVFRRHSSP